MEYQIFKSSDTNVSKFVFEKQSTKEAKAIAVESVLYRYNSYKERTVICCSTQCGCPVGCSFCGTGKFFVRDLTFDEIVEQVDMVLRHIDCETDDIKKFQIMFMSMGEPFMNYENLITAIKILHLKYSNAQLLISTSAPTVINNNFSDFIKQSKEIDEIGLQFSLHESNDEDRHKLISKGSCSVHEIGILGEEWAKEVGRKPYFNYCVHIGNNSDKNIKELLDNFDPKVWECTLSVICEKDSSMKAAIESQLNLINDFAEKMRNVGYSLRVFNPAGQDDIGGGCGQLWYFQQWLKNQKTNK